MYYYRKNIRSSFSHILFSNFKCPWTRFSLALKAERQCSGPGILRGDPFFLGSASRALRPVRTTQDSEACATGPPASPDSCVGCTGDRTAPKQSLLHSEHTPCCRNSAIKLMVDGGGLATYPTTIDNLRNPSPRIVTDTIIHPVSNACWCSVRLEMFKRNKVSKLQCYRISRRCYMRSILFLSLSLSIVDIF